MLLQYHRIVPLFSDGIGELARHYIAMVLHVGDLAPRQPQADAAGACQAGHEKEGKLGICHALGGQRLCGWATEL